MIRIDAAEVRAFADQLRGFPRELRPKLRRNIREAATGLVQDIKSNASWSDRIPGAVKTRVGFGARSSGVQIFVDSGAAPHARPFEGISGGSTFRHPVFGGPAWVSQETRPFFMRAVASNERKVIDAVQSAIDDTLGGL